MLGQVHVIMNEIIHLQLQKQGDSENIYVDKPPLIEYVDKIAEHN